MLNREKYAKEIIEIAVESRLAVKDGKPVKCFGMKCTNCDLCGTKKSCIQNGIEWLNSEYVEPPVDWIKVPVDTPILVRNIESDAWTRRYFAKYENETVYAWSGGTTSWSALDVVKDILDWKMAKLAESEE